MIDIVVINLLKVIIGICNLYLFLLFILAILSLLALFGAVDIFSNSIAGRVHAIIRLMVNPVLSRIARYVPNIGPLDLSFLLFLVSLWTIKDLSNYWILKLSATIFTF